MAWTELRSNLDDPTDWAQYLACPICPALMGEACFTLSSGGPQALAPRTADRPHSSRKPRGAPARKPADSQVRTPADSTTVSRRAGRRTATTTASWLKSNRRRNDVGTENRS